MQHKTLSEFFRLRIFLISLLLLMSACAQTGVVDSWKTEKSIAHKPDKVAVITVLPDDLWREAAEIDIVRVLTDKGIPAVASSTIPGFSGGIRGEIDTEVATGILRQADVDGIVVTFYTGGGESEGYIRSDYWLEYVGSGMSYNWGRPYFTGYTDVYTVRQGPGWADTRKISYWESTYYDLKTEEPIWKIVTKTKDAEHTDTARDVAEKIASEMRSAGLD